MIDSILTSVKKLLTGLAESDTSFDDDIIIHINSALSILNELGMGEPGFRIEGKNETWEEFLGDLTHVDMVKSYVVLKVRLMFDPPSTATMVETYERRIQELEWRINAAVDPLENSEFTK